jgi:hypothetical protein
MWERAELALDDSDTSYFFELLYLSELAIKLLVLEILAGMQDDRENHRYALEFRILRTDGIGGWAEIFDDALTGPPSQHLVPETRESQRALITRWGPDSDSWQRRSVDLLNESCRRLDAAHEDLSHQRVSVRQWIREFVWLRNRTRGHGATKATALSAICPALRNSIDLITSNAPAFGRSWAHLHKNLSGKYRVSPFGGNRGQFEYLTKEKGKDYLLPDGCYIFLDVPRRVPLLFTNIDLIDFFVPNGNFSSGSFEVLSYVTDDARKEDAGTWILPAEARPASETAATPDLDAVGNVFTNMPPRPTGYIKRAALEAELERVLCDGRHPVVTLQGRGGVGKTSLALQVLHNLADGNEFFAIVWFSARDIDLLPQGPRVVRADVLSTDDVARDFSKLMRPGLSLKAGEATRFLTECLSGQVDDGPFLFVLDNFETIRDPVELYAYLDNAIRPPNKVLITTRTRDFKADYPIQVGGMNRDEFIELVRESALRLDITHLVDGAYEDKLFDESDGHPYIAKVLLGEVARAGRSISPKRAVATKDAMLDALFDRSFAALSPAAQRVFLTLCSWRSLVPRIGLEAVLLRPANEQLDIDRALRELEQTSLVEGIKDPEEGREFLSVPLAASLFGKKKLVTSPARIAIEADLELIHGFGATTTTDAARGIGPRVERMANAMVERVEKGEEVTQELAVVEYIATGYPQAWITLSRLQERQLGDMAGAIRSAGLYLESRPGDQEAWTRLIHLYKVTEEPLAEMNARLQLAELNDSAFEDLSSAANRLNRLLYARKITLDADEKRLMVHKLRSLMEARVGEANATDLSRLAWLCLRDQDEAAADRWVQEGLRLDPENEYCLRLKQKLDNEASKA